MSQQSPDKQQPSTIYVWLVPSEQVLDQPGSWRIRKWDTEPFPEATHICAPSAREPSTLLLDIKYEMQRVMMGARWERANWTRLLERIDHETPLSHEPATGAPDMVLLPRELTAENGAKAALIGEFGFPLPGEYAVVHWDTIKLIHRKVVELFGTPGEKLAPPNVEAPQSEVTSAHSEAAKGRAATGLVNGQRTAADASAPPSVAEQNELRKPLLNLLGVVGNCTEAMLSGHIVNQRWLEAAEALERFDRSTARENNAAPRIKGRLVKPGGWQDADDQEYVRAEDYDQLERELADSRSGMDEANKRWVNERKCSALAYSELEQARADLAKAVANHSADLSRALRACCPGNSDAEEPVRCQSYEASEQNQPCPPGRCVMAEPEEGSTPSSTGEQLVTIRKDVARFLLGEAPLESVWWGEPNHKRNAVYWWRNQLRLSMHPFVPSARAFTDDVLEKAMQFKGRADDAGLLARAIIAAIAGGTHG
jgi:hypothetical protein